MDVYIIVGTKSLMRLVLPLLCFCMHGADTLKRLVALAQGLITDCRLRF